MSDLTTAITYALQFHEKQFIHVKSDPSKMDRIYDQGLIQKVKDFATNNSKEQILNQCQSEQTSSLRSS